MNSFRRDLILFCVLALGVGTAMAALLRHPGYTDAYYYFNAGQRLVQGKGLTDAALWTYVGNPPALPAPSHLYWMPLASLIAAAGMVFGGAAFDGAQIGFVMLYAALGAVGFGLGAQWGNSRRAAWLAGILTLGSGFFTPYWTTTSTFAPFGLSGALCLVALGWGRTSGKWQGYALSGAMAALAHLTRADGVLLLMVLILVAATPQRFAAGRNSWRGIAAGLVAYLLVMAPWSARNLNLTGSILPPGGLQTAWMRSYDEIVNYPPGVSLQDFLNWGLGNIAASRWEALSVNVQRFIAEEGMVILTPLMLIGLWKRRREALFVGFGLYALGLHLLMTLVFAFPGYRGGLFHSASALVPFWAVLGVLGLDDVLAWVAPRRRWRLPQAKMFFGTALAAWAVIFSVMIFLGRVPAFNNADGYFREIARHVPPDAVVISNDPAGLYYFTGLPGVVVPNAPPAAILDLARRYGATHLVLDANTTLPLRGVYEGREQPDFLLPDYRDERIQVYRIKQ